MSFLVTNSLITCEQIMVRMIFWVGVMLLFSPAQAWSEGVQPQQPMAPVHNEYHNSTIYSNSVKESPVDPREGIHVYIDPDTGDRVVSVRSRREQSQSPHTFYIEPIVRP